MQLQFLGFLLFCLSSGCQNQKGEFQKKEGIYQNSSVNSIQEMKEGWYVFEKDGNIYKTEIIQIDDTVFKNQVIKLDKQERRNGINSRFFRIEISDSLKIGTNKGIANLYTFNNDFEARASTVIIENRCPDDSIIKDSFSGDYKNLEFGVFGS